jgi:hypothetical protein
MVLNKKKHLVLSALYNFRCLTFIQIYNYAFSGFSQKTCKNTLSEMINKDNFVKKEGYHDKTAYYRLLPAGVKALRNYGVIPVCPEKQDVSRFIPVLSAADIMLKENNIFHQLALNSFVTEFITRYPGLDFEYYDEKYISRIFSDIRPDGIIKTDNVLYFLEMDMNTERPSRLMQKWESYRKFIHSGDYYETCSQSVKVLFILENTGENSRRKFLLQNYIDENLRFDINPDFNLYVDKKEELFNAIDGFILNGENPVREIFKSKDFTVFPADFPKTSLENISFDFGISKGESGEIFVVDDCTDCNMYTYKKLMLYPKLNSLFNSVFGYGLNYIVITRDIREAYELIKQTDSHYDGVYFTTPDRLRDFTFNTALFSIGTNGILYHFDDRDIRVKREENYINAFL